MLEANIRVTGQLEHKTGLVSSARFPCSGFCIAGCHPAAAGWTQIWGTRLDARILYLQFCCAGFDVANQMVYESKSFSLELKFT